MKGDVGTGRVKFSPRSFLFEQSSVPIFAQGERCNHHIYLLKTCQRGTEPAGSISHKHQPDSAEQKFLKTLSACRGFLFELGISTLPPGGSGHSSMKHSQVLGPRGVEPAGPSDLESQSACEGPRHRRLAGAFRPPSASARRCRRVRVGAEPQGNGCHAIYGSRGHFWAQGQCNPNGGPQRGVSLLKRGGF